MAVPCLKHVASVQIGTEQSINRGMINGFFALVEHQILLADISNIAAFTIFGEQVVKWLIPIRPDMFGDRQIPFLAIGKDRIDIEDHTPKSKLAMLHDITNAKTRVDDDRCLKGGVSANRQSVVRIHTPNLEGLRFVTR